MNNGEEKKQLLKDAKEYNEENLIKIEGVGKPGIEIYYSYMSAFKSGYDMTVDEACHYIGCSYTYFVTRIVCKVKHIRINTAARKLIVLFGNKLGDLDEHTFNLLCKRIILHREEFFNYIRSSTVLVQQYKTFTLEEFEDDETLAKIQTSLDAFNKTQGLKNYAVTLISFLQKIVDDMSSKNEPVRSELPEEFELPEKFFSLKEIKKQWGLKYDVEFYRIADANAVNKYLLCEDDFVRYDLREFKREANVLDLKGKGIIKMDYFSYKNMAGINLKEEILRRALRETKKLSL